jgi:hypothetical protein
VAKRINHDHPASEAAAVVVLCRPGPAGAADLTISRPRRSIEAAVDDVAAELGGAPRVRVLLPPVAPDNARWRRSLSDIEALLGGRFGDRLEPVRPAWAGMDLGSASFPTAVVEACETAGAGDPALVIGCDFEGLFMAGVIRSKASTE